MGAIGLLSAMLACCAVLVSCSDETSPRRDQGDTTTIGAQGGPTLERFAGTWQVSVWDAGGNPIPGHTITATANTAGWSQSFPERSDIAVRVLDASGDLVVFEAGPYESVLRPGVRVTALYVTRIEGDRSRGHLIAWYDAPDEAIPVLRGRTEGVRQR